MTTPFRFEQDLPRLLEAAYQAGTPDYRDDLVRRIEATRQRPAWTFPGRWLPMDITVQAVSAPRTAWRTVGILAVVGLLIAALAAVYVGSQRRLPEPFGLAANGVIAYGGPSATGKDGDILVRDSLVANPRPLITGPTDDHDPTYSRDGSRLFFIRTIDGADYLMGAEADGTGIVQLLPSALHTDVIEFSPDGTELAFVNGERGYPRLTLVATDGSGARQLELGDGLVPMGVTYRPPDGRELLVRTQDVDGQEGLHRVTHDGTVIERLPVTTPRAFGAGEWDLTGATYSPDGRFVAYNAPALDEARGTATFRVRVFDTETATDRELPPPTTAPQAHLDAGMLPVINEGWPVYSPDGSRILTHRWTWSQPFPSGWVAVAPADLSAVGTDIGPRIPGDPDTGVIKIWSPDGTMVLIRSDDELVYSVDVATGVAQQLTWGAGNLPDWQRIIRP